MGLQVGISRTSWNRPAPRLEISRTSWTRVWVKTRLPSCLQSQCRTPKPQCHPNPGVPSTRATAAAARTSDGGQGGGGEHGGLPRVCDDGTERLPIRAGWANADCHLGAGWARRRWLGSHGQYAHSNIEHKSAGGSGTWACWKGPAGAEAESGGGELHGGRWEDCHLEAGCACLSGNEIIQNPHMIYFLMYAMFREEKEKDQATPGLLSPQER